MKRNAKTEKQKEFLRLRKEAAANWEAQRKLGYKPLDKPIHHGYDAYWVLRDDVSRRADADRFQYVLDNFGVSTWCRRKDFKTWCYHQKRIVDVNPSFKEIDQYRYDKLSPWVQKFFYSYQKQNYWGGQTYTMYAVNIPSHFLVKKVVKSYKTHYKVIDEILKQEEAEIDARIESKFYKEQRKYWGHNGCSKSWRKIYSKADRAHNKKALRKNMNMMFAKYDDINDDWGCWLSEYCDDFAEFRYTPKRTWW
jgi:hypothetical protein